MSGTTTGAIGTFIIGQSAVGQTVTPTSSPTSTPSPSATVTVTPTPTPSVTSTPAPSGNLPPGGGTITPIENFNMAVKFSGSPVLYDVSLTFGGDLALDSTGDLATSNGSNLNQERIIRRLLTNPGGYVWHGGYGGGLARFIGRPASPTRVSAISRAQMALEAAVAVNPRPTITTSVGKDGTFVLSIQYTDAATGAAQVLSLPVGD